MKTSDLEALLNPDATAGLGFLVCLSSVFVILKITDRVDWSWWWVLLPVWLPVAFGLLSLLAGAALVTVKMVWDAVATFIKANF